MYPLMCAYVWQPPPRLCSPPPPPSLHSCSDGTSSISSSQVLKISIPPLQGWQPEASDMKTVVGIHNSVNERAWSKVQTWEQLHCAECEFPRLKRFKGKPNELSPKARLLNFMVRCTSHACHTHA
jgi:cytochrome c heme-lyase